MAIIAVTLAAVLLAALAIFALIRRPFDDRPARPPRYYIHETSAIWALRLEQSEAPAQVSGVREAELEAPQPDWRLCRSIPSTLR